MSGFHAVLRVRAIDVVHAKPEALAGLPAVGYILVPLWTTIADHDGAAHTVTGDECSLAICDLGGGSARDAEELWAARRAMLPFLAAVPNQGTPQEVRDTGIVDQSRARLAHLAAELGRAGDLQSPLLSLTVGDVRALRWLVIAEMGRIAPVVAQSAAETAPAPITADAPVYVHPDSPLERVARALGVAATEAAMIAEAHRLHGVLAAQRRRDDDAADETAERPLPSDWSGRRSKAFGEVAARLGVEADPAAVLAAVESLVERCDGAPGRAESLVGDARGRRAAGAADQEIADAFMDALIEASADRVAEIVTGRGK